MIKAGPEPTKTTMAAMRLAIARKPGAKTVTRDTTRDATNNVSTKRTHADRQKAYRQRLKKRGQKNSQKMLSALVMGSLGMGV